MAGPTDGKLRRSKPERLKPTAVDLGLSRKNIREARQIRDAEWAIDVSDRRHAGLYGVGPGRLDKR